ncbi:MtnX-like HAD-IB family phosphatase [Clostridium formicaceticum]|uniref:2,3-diketo-5-methylthio-1-phosphopentane phosphatase n=1 Tax=Clostridium formicaceticum TaxID=1497 RepID=A0AAC9RJ21_9CLOT|nr:MtnX-like HAD-IB family phosphatase [Clostridium formicaceticum]AOY77454.1 2,3-diketo-5-methylthio-1-phosphopentane phosphatase [Clostridium formicaceticum]ARE88011.1 2-hydroxy-3-keto-5-methylthiopentenyl-1-phosphate phosphatase [Clostridium formicaceticum]
MEKISYVFFVDFDGTITKTDVCETIIAKLAGPGWKEINKKWERKELSTLACAKETFKLFTRKDPEAFQEIVETVEVNEGFKAFVAYCQTKGYPIYILSDGYDYYIEYILNREGLTLPYYSNKLTFSADLEVATPHHSKDCGLCGVCKTALIQQLRKKAEKSIYIGDGSSDFCPAEKVDYVFAKKRLLNHCLSLGRQVYSFNNFKDILNQMQRLEEGQ